jgi:hypothetical protein
MIHMIPVNISIITKYPFTMSMKFKKHIFMKYLTTLSQYQWTHIKFIQMCKYINTYPYLYIYIRFPIILRHIIVYSGCMGRHIWCFTVNPDEDFPKQYPKSSAFCRISL